MRFFGTNFLTYKCDQPILKKNTLANGKIEYVSVVQNRTESSSDSEMLIESFSDEENDTKKDAAKESNGKTKSEDSPDLKSHHDATEIRRLLRRKDELERKQKMEQKYNERLQVSLVSPSKGLLRCGVLSEITELLLKKKFYDFSSAFFLRYIGAT